MKVSLGQHEIAILKGIHYHVRWEDIAELTFLTDGVQLVIINGDIHTGRLTEFGGIMEWYETNRKR